MYKSPIDVLIAQYINDVVTAEENAVMSAVLKCGINVDKDELVKALAYDRGQYAKGYGDAKAELIRCKDCIHNVANRETDPMDITDYSGKDIVCDYFMTDGQEPDDYCSKARAKEIDNAEKS